MTVPLPVPKYKGSITKMGLESREDLMLTLMLGVGIYFAGRALIHHPLGSLISLALAGAIWRFVLVGAVRSFRRMVPPNYLMHWIRSRVLLTPILHPRPDHQPLPLSVRKP